MLRELLSAVPHEAPKIALVLALALFVGLEREEHKQREATYAFGGIRTFPLISLVSYALALLGGPLFVPWAVGLVVVGALLLLSYSHKLAADPPAGLTTEISALATYVMGALVQHEYYWIATTLAVLSVLLLELKKGLEGLTRLVEPGEIVTVAKFLVLAAVILPIVPNEQLTRFHLNPFRIWLVVVAVNGISFASYALQRLFRERAGLLLSAVLGGAYSSTITTVALARQSRGDPRPNRYAGSILTASGTMYARLALLVALFNPALGLHLAPSFLALAAAGEVGGWLVYRRGAGDEPGGGARREPKNPLELAEALLFAAVFVAVLVVTALAREYLGRAGLYSLAALMGVTDVDPYILGLTQATPSAVSPETAAKAIAIAAASNNVVKALYAYGFADRATGRRSLVLLLGLAALGLVPLLWL